MAADGPFYAFITNLYCLGIIDVYPDNTFHWTEDANRVTLARWVVKARGWSVDLTGAPHFSDVAPTHPDYDYVETAFNHGYAAADCPGDAACFKPTNNLTRGQMSKMIVNGFGWSEDTNNGSHFRDVEQSNPFYWQIEPIFSRGIVDGYDCGGSCREFRWMNALTRGQLSKVLSRALEP